MRIGIDIRSIGRQRTGDETYTQGLVSALLEADKNSKFFLYTDTDERAELERIKGMLGPNCQRKKVSIVSILPSSKAVWTLFCLPKRAKKDRLDILHVQYISPFVLSKKTALVTTIHDISFKRYPQYIGIIDLLFLNLLIPLSLKRANAVVAVSDFTKKEILECYSIDKEKVRTVANGYHAEFFEKDLSIESKRSFKAKQNLQNPYLFYLGTLQPRKNIPFLIRGFAFLKKKYGKYPAVENLQLVIGGSLGGKNVDQNIFKEIGKIGRSSIKDSIKFVGYVGPEDLPYFYQCAEAYVNSSNYEGFGLPLIESMGSGTPVVCCDSSCFSEIAGDAAMFFKNNDKEGFARAVYEVLSKDFLKEVLVQKGRENAKRFSWEKNAKQVLEIYGIIRQDKTQK